MLGVPLGDDVFVSAFVETNMLGRLQDTVNQLVEFEDAQAATYLLRVSFSIVRLHAHNTSCSVEEASCEV